MLNDLKITGRFSPVCRAEHRSFWRELPEGVRQGCRTSAEGLGSPFCRPSAKARSAGNKRHPGRLFFGYFLLAEQKKVSRLSGRAPTSTQPSRQRHNILIPPHPALSLWRGRRASFQTVRLILRNHHLPKSKPLIQNLMHIINPGFVKRRKQLQGHHNIRLAQIPLYLQ